jgi:hypothetical protein
MGATSVIAVTARPSAPAQIPPGPVWLAPPQLPPWPVVWFALDGGSETRGVDGAVRVWGLAVDDGEAEPTPEAITADFDDPGGRHAWERFVTRASGIMRRQPGARWVHYSLREGRRLLDCAATHGAPAGFLERMEEALFELLPRGVQRCVRLPLGSCSLREVAGFAGFRWRDPGPNPGVSTLRCEEARASVDPVRRERILQGILAGNADDLRAMRAVWRWLLREGPKNHCG